MSEGSVNYARDRVDALMVRVTHLEDALSLVAEKAGLEIVMTGSWATTDPPKIEVRQKAS